MSGDLTDAKTLRAAGRSLALPFSVELADGRVLHMQRVLRLLPGKRVAGEAVLGGRPVFAKLFIAESGERHWQAECRGIQALREAAIPTPAVLNSGRLKAGGFILVSEYLRESESLAAAWERAAAIRDETQALAVLSPAFVLLARMHAAGLSQDDLHLGNFLRCGDSLRVIDGDSVVVAPAPLSTTAAAGNLGMLLAQLPAAWDRVAAESLAIYQASGGVTGIDVAALQSAIDRVRAWRVRDYLGKSVRDCTLFAVTRTVGRFVSVLRAEKERLLPILVAPDDALAAGVRLKSGNTCTVARVASPGGDIVVKRYNLKSVGHALSRLWRPSRAWHSWREAHRLCVHGIATPGPLAVIEERIGPLRRRAWLIAEHCPGVNLADHLDPSSLPPEGEAAALSELFRLLCRLRITHGDLKATNLLWHDGRVWLIDLDACTQHRSDAAWRRAWQKDRSRLLRNWPEGSPLRGWFDGVLPEA